MFRSKQDKELQAKYNKLELDYKQLLGREQQKEQAEIQWQSELAQCRQKLDEAKAKEDSLRAELHKAKEEKYAVEKELLEKQSAVGNGVASTTSNAAEVDVTPLRKKILDLEVELDSTTKAAEEAFAKMELLEKENEKLNTKVSELAGETEEQKALRLQAAKAKLESTQAPRACYEQCVIS